MLKKIVFAAIIVAFLIGTAFAQSSPQALSLKQGFNFIAFTLKPSLAPAQFKSQFSSVDEIYSFSAASGSFLSVSDGTLTTFNAGRGYIIKANAAASITVDGSAVSTLGNISLKAGFNLIGISKQVDPLKFSELTVSNSSVKALYKYSAASGSFIQVIRNASGIGELSDGIDPSFAIGQSYFINMASDNTLNYDGNKIVIGGGVTPPATAVATPAISPNGGTFTAAQQVTITCATPGAAIKYTIDGSVPSATAGTDYSAPFTVSATTTVKAIAVKSGMTNSEIVTSMFTINNNIAKNTLVVTNFPAAEISSLTAILDGAGLGYDFVLLNALHAGSFSAASLAGKKNIFFLNGNQTAGSFTLNAAQAGELRDFVNSGGNLYFTARAGNAALNSLIGVTAAGNDGGSNGSDWPVVQKSATVFTTHPLTQGLSNASGDAGASVTLDGNWSVLGKSADAMPLLSARISGAGKIVMWYAQRSFRNAGTTANVYESDITQNNNGQLMTNIINWFKSTDNTLPPAVGNTISIDLGGGVKLEMVKIPAGTFQMGSPAGEAGRNSNETIHAVTISKDYYMGKYEVTQGQWKAIMDGVNPSYIKTSDNYPVESVSWVDITTATTGFLAKANAKISGLGTLRLPTEAEWEYACRANTATAYYWGANIDGNYCWYSLNSGSYVQQVGTRQPNAWGLYDMSGNLIEWCSDYFGAYSAGPLTDPAGPAMAVSRAARGGSWAYDAVNCRSANRFGFSPASRDYGVGFRLVLESYQAPVQGKVEPCVITPNGGTFTAAQSVAITCPTAGAAIKYTTDGTTPSAAVGTAYSASFTVSATTTVKAVAIKTGMTDSDVAAAVFTINTQQPPPAGGNNITIDLGGGVKLEMVKISAGTFQMGEAGLADPVHAVTISKDYYIGKYEVTQGQWKAIMNGANPSGFQTNDSYPVETVSYIDITTAATGFLANINAKISGQGTFRLPTEAEWEYACRAGSTTTYYWGAAIDDGYLWYETNSGGNSALQTGTRKPNAWGLYDMSGNVQEWCSDWYEAYGGTAVTDPAGPASGTKRVNRGGGWLSPSSYCRSADRRSNTPSSSGFNLGFRLVLSPGQ